MVMQPTADLLVGGSNPSWAKIPAVPPTTIYRPGFESPCPEPPQRGMALRWGHPSALRPRVHCLHALRGAASSYGGLHKGVINLAFVGTIAK